MSKKNLVDEIANRAGLSKTSVSSVLDSLSEVAMAAVANGIDLTIPGVGKIATRQKPARVGRNPKTGEPVSIAAKTAVTFKPAKALIDAAN